MSKNLVLVAILLVTLLLGIVHVAYYHPKLPDSVASHFDFEGNANGFSPKRNHSLVMACLQVGFGVFFWVLVLVLKYIPPQLVNLPNRDYWLAPERRKETIHEMNGGLLGFAIATQIFLVALNHLTTLHNLGTPAMHWFWPVFIGYGCYVRPMQKSVQKTGRVMRGRIARSGGLPPTKSTTRTRGNPRVTVCSQLY